MNSDGTWSIMYDDIEYVSPSIKNGAKIDLAKAFEDKRYKRWCEKMREDGGYFFSQEKALI